MCMNKQLTPSTGLSRLQSDAITTVANRIGNSLGNKLVTLIDKVFDMMDDEMSNRKNQK